MFAALVKLIANCREVQAAQLSDQRKVLAGSADCFRLRHCIQQNFSGLRTGYGQALIEHKERYSSHSECTSALLFSVDCCAPSVRGKPCACGGRVKTCVTCETRQGVDVSDIDAVDKIGTEQSLDQRIDAFRSRSCAQAIKRCAWTVFGWRTMRSKLNEIPTSSPAALIRA